MTATTEWAGAADAVDPGGPALAERWFAVAGGFPGFPQLSELSISAIDDHALFVWLTAPGAAGVSFLAVNPFVPFPDYDVPLGDADQLALAVEAGDELIVYCLVTVDRPRRRASANLVAPVVINVTRGRLRQVILDDEDRMRAPLPASEASASDREDTWP